MTKNDGVIVSPGVAAAGAEPRVEAWVRHYDRVQSDAIAVIPRGPRYGDADH